MEKCSCKVINRPGSNLDRLISFCSLHAAAPDMLAALKEISEGRGPFSCDQLTFATNTIEAMKEKALEAIALAKPKPDPPARFTKSELMWANTPTPDHTFIASPLVSDGCQECGRPRRVHPRG